MTKDFDVEKWAEDWRDIFKDIVYDFSNIELKLYNPSPKENPMQVVENIPDIWWWFDEEEATWHTFIDNKTICGNVTWAKPHRPPTWEFDRPGSRVLFGIEKVCERCNHAWEQKEKP